MAVALLGLFILGIAALVALAFRWTRPRPNAPDLRRADEAQTEDLPNAKTVRDRVRMYISIYGPRK